MRKRERNEKSQLKELKVATKQDESLLLKLKIRERENPLPGSFFYHLAELHNSNGPLQWPLGPNLLPIEKSSSCDLLHSVIDSIL